MKVETAVDARHLRKAYGTRLALDDLSFVVNRGEIFAILGPNGAGKTTAIEMMEGYRRPDHGELRVLGLDPHRQGGALRPQVGVMLQGGGLYPALTSLECLTLFASYYPRSQDPRSLLELVGLEDVGNTRYRRLSGGQKQRLSLALALVGYPRLVFLDEPTAGLDPQGRRVTWRLIKELKQADVTVVLSTHYLEEAEELADRVAILDSGKLLALDSPEKLRGMEGSVAHLRTGLPISIGKVQALPACAAVRPEGDGRYLIEAHHMPDLVAELGILLRDENVPLVELTVGEVSLEDMFLRLTGQDREQIEHAI